MNNALLYALTVAVWGGSWFGIHAEHLVWKEGDGYRTDAGDV